MYVLYEDSGKLKAAKIFSEAESSLQIETASGKRSKIKRNTTLFDFSSPEPETLLTQAEQIAAGLDIDFLWECAPQTEFHASELAQDYFGESPDAIQKTAMIMALANAPAYFHRRGKGAYKPAPPDILKAALAAIEKKRIQEQQRELWVEHLLAGQLPDELRNAAKNHLDRPDKNTQEWKALDTAMSQSGVEPEKFLLDLGVWPNQLVMLRERFFSKHFPKGTDWPELTIPILDVNLPQSDVIAYSIDDANTTEIDDALSVQVIDANTVCIGIHIAAPALSIKRDDDIYKQAYNRMSTIYMPGAKIPMLPDALVQQFSLQAGVWCPALSLYITGDLSSGEITNSTTKIEQIKVKANLRHSDFDSNLTAEQLSDPDFDCPYADWLKPLWQFAMTQTKIREEMRGRPENNDRIEYSFELEGPADDPQSIVHLIPRQRNSPIDRLVAEYMILANTQWGALLAKYGVPGIYRSQQTGRTRMSTHALPHESIGVPQYIWSTSPLRRFVDLINQSQIIAAAEHQISARLAAPFKPKDADLYALISAFESQYTLWGDFQSTLERFWCIRWLQQQQITQTTAHVLRDNLIRLGCAPFVTRINGLPELERGHEIIIDILSYDELNLEIECRLVSVN